MKLSEVVAVLTAELLANGDSIVRYIKDEEIESRGYDRVEPYTFQLAPLSDIWNPLEIRIERDL